MSMELFISRANKIANLRLTVEDLKEKYLSIPTIYQEISYKKLLIAQQIRKIGTSGMDIERGNSNHLNDLLIDLRGEFDNSSFLSEIYQSLSIFIEDLVLSRSEITKEKYKNWLLSEIDKDHVNTYSYNDISFLVSFIREDILEILEDDNIISDMDSEDMGLLALDSLFYRARSISEDQILKLLEYMVLPEEEVDPIDFIATHGSDKIELLKADLMYNDSINLSGDSSWNYLISLSDRILDSIRSDSSYDSESQSETGELDPKKPHLMHDIDDQVDMDIQLSGTVSEESIIDVVN